MRVKRSLEGKLEARERDRERKRRDQLTSEQLEHVRKRERIYKKHRRQNMNDIDKAKEKENRKRKYEPRNLKKKRNVENLKEMKNIEQVIRMRKFRSLLSEKEKHNKKFNSKVGMALGRKNGFLRVYKQRKKRNKNDLYVWKDFFEYNIFVDLFLETNSKKSDIKEKLTSIQRKIRDFENKRRAEAHMQSRMTVWKGWSLSNKEEVCSKNGLKMRKHRGKIKKKIQIEDFKVMKSKDGNDCSDQENNEDHDYDSDCYY